MIITIICVILFSFLLIAIYCGGYIAGVIVGIKEDWGCTGCLIATIVAVGIICGIVYLATLIF